jgi:hypothetical protein
LLEQRAAQHRLGRQALPSGRLDRAAVEVGGHQVDEIRLLIEPVRDRLSPRKRRYKA